MIEPSTSIHSPAEENSVRKPKLISTASVTLTLPMHVPYLPAEGTSVTATSSFSLVGDGFVVASAAARQGVPVGLASPLGTGANSHAVRAALIEEGITLEVEDMVGDTGMSISLIQTDGLMTTVRSPGVEADPQLSDLRKIPLYPQDIVYISGLDLAGQGAGRVLRRWLEEIPDNIRVVVSIGGAIDVIPQYLLSQVLERANILTMNHHQAVVLARRLNMEDPWEAGRACLQDDATLVMRMGPQGSVYQVGVQDTPQQMCTFIRQRVDTTGVGDTHTGVLMACVLQGMDIPHAVARANVAAAVAVSKFGTAVCPTATQIDEIIAAEGKTVEDMTQVYDPS